MIRVLKFRPVFLVRACTSPIHVPWQFECPKSRVPANCPFESRCNPSAPDARVHHQHIPCVRSAARRNAITDGSSSISRIGCWPVAFAGRKAHRPASFVAAASERALRRQPESRTTTCFRISFIAPALESSPPWARHNPVQCSSPGPSLSPPASLYKTDQNSLRIGRCLSPLGR